LLKISVVSAFNFFCISYFTISLVFPFNKASTIAPKTKGIQLIDKHHSQLQEVIGDTLATFKRMIMI